MAEKVLMKGNEAIAEAALRAGCRLYFAYPITPQSELIEYMSKMMPKVGGTFVQSESEIAAINMVYGASGCGKRVMTSSSSPGISLKQEGISYISGASLPAVIVNVVRGGPGLGDIQPAQGDYFQATRGGGHGDYRTIVLAPSTVQEFADMAPLAFDLADKYRIAVLILSDGLIGQMMEPVEFQSAKTEKELEDQLFEQLSSIRLDEKTYKRILKTINERHSDLAESFKNQKKTYQTQINKVDEMLSELTKMRLKKQINQKDYETQKGELSEQKHNLKEKLEDNDFNQDNWVHQLEMIIGLCFQIALQKKFSKTDRLKPWMI